MRKKSIKQLLFSWFILLGMLFHVLVQHQDASASLMVSQLADGQIKIENTFRHAQTHSFSSHADHEEAGHSHDHLDVEHPESYTCPSSTQASDLLSLRLTTILVSLPVWSEQMDLRLELAPVFRKTEPQPPPEQPRLALTTTILLI